MSEEDEFFRRFMKRFPFFSFPFTRSFGYMDEFFKELERSYEELFRDLGKEMPKDLVKERRLSDGSISRQIGPFIYGYSVTIGPDGKPIVREFGNVRPSARRRPGVELVEKREPLVDVIDEDDTVKIIAEVPGVEKENIKLDATEDSLTISAEAERRYHKKISLPAPVDTESAKASYKNGILEVVLKKLKPPEKGRPIKVE